MLSGVALQLPWIQSCSSSKQNIPVPDNIQPLSLKAFLNVYTVLDILFPNDGNGPGAAQLKSDHYFLWTLKDPQLDPSTRSFLLDKLNKLNEESIRLHGSNFHDLDRSEQEAYVAELSTNEWSENWLSRLLTLIFESLFLDSKYNVNPNNVGWKWLSFAPGYPRPTEAQLYPTILNKKHEV